MGRKRQEPCSICARVGGSLVTCSTCHQLKQPRGRSAPIGAYYCDTDCPGYYDDPKPEELWPGEVYGESLGHMDWHGNPRGADR